MHDAGTPSPQLGRAVALAYHVVFALDRRVWRAWWVRRVRIAELS